MHDAYKWLWIAPVLAAVLAGVLSWYVSHSLLGAEIAKIESGISQRLPTRFDIENAAALESSLRREIDRLDDRIDELYGDGEQ